ncbi:HlyD family efflux transporter periplasmic adaptor subunit [Xanthobacter dioxanivorans]|uniref:HlyD family efflux transporter periplasmic adaptor subunit n=1 Tax=Xanthobacter dioxanivorans TaxID=2528964 RepID=A0A974PQL5_9HYPH|nr:HlyD family efflux transporter periplasmic adaptor subunit [Xanthobacter dioxanivorans]QRG07933.1 HlyD family efflux transporter periplasmic adaptor subunit [Xanthobacter dioxanivorans]
MKRMLVLVGFIVVLVAAGGAGAWYLASRSRTLPPGFASGNGRIEATQVDVATKAAGRVLDVLAEEGDFVHQGQVVGHMDVQETEAALRTAQAQANQARQSRDTASHVVEQRKGELDLAGKELERQEILVSKGFATEQKVDQYRTTKLTAQAALAAAESSLAASGSAISAAEAEVDRLTRMVEDGTLVAPKSGRVIYRLAEPGEVLGAGGKVLTLIDLSDVYMTIFLPATDAGALALGAEARLLLEPLPDRAVPATVSFVSARAQFTPKQVETQRERDRMMFRVKLRIARPLVEKYIDHVKTGVTGVGYVRLDPKAQWPSWLDSDLVHEAAQ